MKKSTVPMQGQNLEIKMPFDTEMMQYKVPAEKAKMAPEPVRVPLQGSRPGEKRLPL